jgi:cytochrome oxidase Cu insertion factor (SCO1/SenC/PrrC family)
MTMSYKSMFCHLLLVLALVVGLGVEPDLTEAQVKADHQSKVKSYNPAGNFTLTDQDGQPFQLARLRGKVALLFFGYTSCPDACPTTLSKLSRVYKMLDPEADRVITLFVSVDPGRDTPSVLKEYLKYFRVNSVGLTGTKEEIDSVVRKYGARYEIEKSDSAAGYHINHSTDLYLLNQKGELARRFKYGDGTQLIANEVRRLFRPI